MDCKGMVESAARLEAPRCRPGLIVAADTLSVGTRERAALIDITGSIVKRIRASGVREGLAHVFSVHTTAALVINELEPALIRDLREFLERLVDPADPWRHDRPEISGCDRRTPPPTCARSCSVPESSFRSVQGVPRSAASRESCWWNWMARAIGQSD